MMTRDTVTLRGHESTPVNAVVARSLKMESCRHTRAVQRSRELHMTKSLRFGDAMVSYLLDAGFGVDLVLSSSNRHAFSSLGQIVPQSIMNFLLQHEGVSYIHETSALKGT